MTYTTNVYVWVWLAAFTGLFLAVYWGVWLYSKWFYCLTIALLAAVCIALGLAVYEPFKQEQGIFLFFAPLAMFLLFWYAITVKFLRGETFLDLEGLQFFMDDVRAKSNPSLAEKVTLFIGYGAGAVTFLICGERLYFLFAASLSWLPQ